MMKRVMLLLMSLGLPQVPAQLHTHTCVSPKSHRPDDSKQPPFILQQRKMRVCVCFPHLHSQYRVRWENFFLSNISKDSFTLNLIAALSPEHDSSKSLELPKVRPSWEFVGSPNCKDFISRNNMSCWGYQWA